jgi:hypothetical protein
MRQDASREAGRGLSMELLARLLKMQGGRAGRRVVCSSRVNHSTFALCSSSESLAKARQSLCSCGCFYTIESPPKL